MESFPQDHIATSTIKIRGVENFPQDHIATSTNEKLLNTKVNAFSVFLCKMRDNV